MSPTEIVEAFAEVDLARARAEERAGDVAGERARVVRLLGRMMIDVDRSDGWTAQEREGARRLVARFIQRIEEQDPTT